MKRRNFLISVAAVLLGGQSVKVRSPIDVWSEINVAVKKHGRRTRMTELIEARLVPNTNGTYLLLKRLGKYLENCKGRMVWSEFPKNTVT